MRNLGIALHRITIVCSDPCDGWPCLECEMMEEAISMAVKGSIEDGTVRFEHRSVSEATEAYKGVDFNDLDAPYFMLDDEVRLNGREWRVASLESVVSILSIGLGRL
jgi:hypothetical protein